MTSASFSIEGTTVPAAVAVAYGATVDFVLLSTVGAKSIAWTIAGSSDSSYTNPTITPAGVPSGATASCPQIADPGTGLGASFLVKCVVTDSNNVTYTQYGVFGTANAAGRIPITCGEMLARDATHGWTEAINTAIGSLRVFAAGTLVNDWGTVNANTFVGATVSVPGALPTDTVLTNHPSGSGNVLCTGYAYADNAWIRLLNVSTGGIVVGEATTYWWVLRAG